jgi:fucose permease
VARYAELGLGLEAVRGGAAISAFWTGLLVGRLAAGLSPRAPGAGTIAILAVAASAVIAAFGRGLIPSPELAMAVTGFCLGGVFPILIALAGVTLPGQAGTAVGLAAGAGALGGFVVPWLTGRIATTSQLSTAFLSLSGWLALLALCSAIARQYRARSLGR